MKLWKHIEVKNLQKPKTCLKNWKKQKNLETTTKILKNMGGQALHILKYAL